MTIVEKAAYLKGLAEGLGVEPDSRDGKLWGALTDLLSDMAHQVEELQEQVEDQDDVLDDVYEQLIYLQEITLPEEKLEDWDEDDDEDEEDDLYTPSLRIYDGEEDEEEEPLDLLADEGEEDGEELDGILYDVTCPGCGETITFDEETLEQGSIRCPTCGETLEFDLGSDGEE